MTDNKTENTAHEEVATEKLEKLEKLEKAQKSPIKVSTSLRAGLLKLRCW